MANQNKSNRPTEASRNGTTGEQGNLKTASRPASSASSGAPKLTPRQQAARRRAQKRRRTQLLITGGIIAVIAIALIIIGISISQPVNFDAIPAAANLDQRPFELGPADAKVTVEEYGDFQCPVCKTWHDNNQTKLVSDYITSGKSVKFVFRDFPFLDNNYATRESHLMAEAAYCASDQKRSWDFYNALYDNQKPENSGYWTSDHLKALAKSLKLDTGTFNSCMDSNKYRSKVNTDATTGNTKGVQGTPSFAINGTLLDLKDPNDYAKLSEAITNALNGTTPGANGTPGAAVTAAPATTSAATTTTAPAATPTK